MQLIQHDPSSWSAVTIQLQDNTFIVHNAAHAPVRQESDIMHEVAHIVRRHEPSQLITLDGLDVTLRTYDVAQEEEAAWLGAALQLPRAALLWAIREGMSDTEISQHFNASVSQIRYRRGVTGVDIQRRRRRSSAIA
jgi:Zn-dependent peptidase ImmA (M78 family)